MQSQIKRFYAIVFKKDSGLPILIEKRGLSVSIDDTLLAGFLSALQNFAFQCFNMKIKVILFENSEGSMFFPQKIKLTCFSENPYVFVLMTSSTIREDQINVKFRELRSKIRENEKKMLSSKITIAWEVIRDN
ncbi:MAG: hypothetical protein ACFFC7_12460 [Candidatus Hermodarchaeota archaeon]